MLLGSVPMSRFFIFLLLFVSGEIFYCFLHKNIYQFPFQDAIFRVVAALLHLGNIEFVKGQEIDSSEPKDDKSRVHLRMAAELFMFVIFFFFLCFRILIPRCDELRSNRYLHVLFRCDEKSLEDSLCKRVIVTRDETITKWLDPDSAAVSRDALAKIVYSRLFDW